MARAAVGIGRHRLLTDEAGTPPPAKPLTLLDVEQEQRDLDEIRQARADLLARLGLTPRHQWTPDEIQRLAQWEAMLSKHPGRELPERYRNGGTAA